MTPLRQRFLEDLQRRNYAARTLSTYTSAVAAFARHFGRSPEHLDAEHVRQYQLHLIAQHASWSAFNQAVCALRLLYRLTLGRPGMVEMIPFGKKPKTLPAVFSQDEVSRVIAAACDVDDRFAVMVQTTYGCGLRISEVSRLRIADIDSARMALHIRCSKGRLDDAFATLIHDYTVGDPMRPGVRWTNLSLRRIREDLIGYGFRIGVMSVAKLLHRFHFGRRQAQKKLSPKRHPQRDQQFRKIERLRAEYQNSPNPIISVDTKKKELIGNLYREGHLYTDTTIHTLDHDFPTSAEGVAYPHGIYDPRRNVGHINLGTSHDTSRFACDSIAHWWEKHGRAAYPQAKSILLLCDGGGSNSSRRYVFKYHLQRLADRLQIEIRVAHYPPGCSKYDPIEHRFFPHVTRACQGVISRPSDWSRRRLPKPAQGRDCVQRSISSRASTPSEKKPPRTTRSRCGSSSTKNSRRGTIVPFRRTREVKNGQFLTFTWKDYRAQGKEKEMTLSVEEFTRRFLQHVLPCGFVRIRHYGLLANRGRAEKLSQCRRLLATATTAQTLQSSVQPAAEEPHRCRACGQGVMIVVELLPRQFDPDAPTREAVDSS